MGVGRLNMVQIIAIVVIIAGMVLTNRAKRRTKA
jgi:drug/metabolite transporter (DMT)-like permease